MTRVILIRHGETVWNARGLYQGQEDSPLTPEGQVQAQALAERMRQHPPIDALYTSDLPRTHATAAPTALALGLKTIVEPALGERNYGIFQGENKATIKERFPTEYAAHTSGNIDYAIPEGESNRQFHDRVITALNALGTHHVGEQIAIVTHGGVLTMIFKHVLGLPIAAPRYFSVPNTSYNLLCHVDDRWRVETIGDTSHLGDRALDNVE
jgi:2,3-bisphosphoglycerate-dependent phosphoglycerate mutase